MIPGPEILAALDQFSPRHKPIFTNVLRPLAMDDITGAAYALGKKCSEVNLQELPNPYPKDDQRYDCWAYAFRCGLTGEQMKPATKMTDAPILKGPSVLPDFSEMTKPQINDWAADNLGEATNQRLKKPDMIAEVRRLAKESGY